MSKVWSAQLPVVQFRVARPTDQLDKIITFYRDGLGLRQVAAFEGHDGYDGVMFGLPGVDYHLEFTQHVEGSPCPAPTKDNLLVFYIPDQEARDAIVTRLEKLGFGPPVEPENPYWRRSGITIEDPDGWRVVLMNTSGLSGTY
ncbi:VOC family protein [Brevibacillus humidisoli]|uniref:VOC family protein n=1 Tax=Brevibacillus humidisoli TaxID=2895522 RepID=UPI001E2E6E5D|nr:VOC family protein [Brevibacillus humidisoli]UFJ39276.1 VOC family protein [Brevibacillus humidisoli]